MKDHASEIAAQILWRFVRHHREEPLVQKLCEEFRSSGISLWKEEKKYTELQDKIYSIMSERWGWNRPRLWTVSDLAAKLPGHSAVGIGAAIARQWDRIYSSQVARLVGSQKLRVYSIEPIDEMSKGLIRLLYTQQRRLSQPSIKA